MVALFWPKFSLAYILNNFGVVPTCIPWLGQRQRSQPTINLR
jgi:hypothetical protein